MQLAAGARGTVRRPLGLRPSGSNVPPLALLLVRSGVLRGERLVVADPVANIGRADYNDIRLPDPSVGASHARLQLREGVWSIADLGSTHGTMVDGEAVVEECPLAPGAVVGLGAVQLSFDPRDKFPPRVRAVASDPEPERSPRRRTASPARHTLRAALLIAALLLGALLLVGSLVLG